MKQVVFCCMLLLAPCLITGQTVIADQIDLLINEIISNSDQLKVQSTLALMTPQTDSAQGNITDIVFSYIYDSLFKTRTFRLIERESVNLLLDQLQFELSGAVDDEKAKNIGKMLNVDYLCYGQILDLNGDIRVALKIVNIETGEIEAYGSTNISGDLLKKADRIAKQPNPSPFFLELNIGNVLLLGPSLGTGINLHNLLNPFAYFRYGYLGLMTIKIFGDGWILSPKNWTIGIGNSFNLFRFHNIHSIYLALSLEYFSSLAYGDYETPWQTERQSNGLIAAAVAGYQLQINRRFFLKADAGVMYGYQFPYRDIGTFTGLIEYYSAEDRVIPQLGLSVGVNL